MAKRLIFVLIPLATVCFLVTLGDSEQTVIRRELAFNWALRVAGGVIALLAAAGLAGQWLNGARADRLLPGVVVLLAGLSLAGQSWPVVLGLGAIGVALTAQGFRPGPKPPTDPPA